MCAIWESGLGCFFYLSIWLSAKEAKTECTSSSWVPTELKGCLQHFHMGVHMYTVTRWSICTMKLHQEFTVQLVQFSHYMQALRTKSPTVMSVQAKTVSLVIINIFKYIYSGFHSLSMCIWLLLYLVLKSNGSPRELCLTAVTKSNLWNSGLDLLYSHRFPRDCDYAPNLTENVNDLCWITWPVACKHICSLTI